MDFGRVVTFYSESLLRCMSLSAGQRNANMTVDKTLDMARAESVAVIGAGSMGEPISKHLLAADFAVSVYDVDEQPLRRLEAEGVEIAESVADAAANADLSLVFVGTTEQVDKVLTGDDGVFQNAGENHVVAIGSTISPGTCVAFGELADEYDIPVLDVPVCGGTMAAEDGDLLVLGGGDGGVFDAVRPVFEQYAAPDGVVHFGKVGSGQVVKAVNNYLMWTAVVADYEAMSLAASYGIDIHQLRDVLARSSADNWILRQWEQVYTTWAHMDMEILRRMADDYDETMPLASLVEQQIRTIGPEDIQRFL